MFIVTPKRTRSETTLEASEIIVIIIIRFLELSLRTGEDT